MVNFMVVTVKNKYTKLSSIYFDIKLYVDENGLLDDCVWENFHIYLKQTFMI